MSLVASSTSLLPTDRAFLSNNTSYAENRGSHHSTSNHKMRYWYLGIGFALATLIATIFVWRTLRKKYSKRNRHEPDQIDIEIPIPHVEIPPPYTLDTSYQNSLVPRDATVDSPPRYTEVLGEEPANPPAMPRVSLDAGTGPPKDDEEEEHEPSNGNIRSQLPR
ncbi:hypothetical protein NEOLI_003125 [Neolecta irregularis DAH-3]|uniref:Uncharacterized protein n=1 Tax=Neolecta irregularis (strain DAH-3) TaxID=1198029 RepID=A0A1U7LNH9_NEOID|nr:hypothetical protein NEOLI_003125 [Neolecta irregularis DAH-3]|eukprot:OLL24081.1 hypothetical protein NEOLI_003125 [Neolecta irregularis DAH-3]